MLYNTGADGTGYNGFGGDGIGYNERMRQSNAMSALNDPSEFSGTAQGTYGGMYAARRTAESNEGKGTAIRRQMYGNMPYQYYPNSMYDYYHGGQINMS